MSHERADLLALLDRLTAEGRYDDAAVILSYAQAWEPNAADLCRRWMTLDLECGRPLDAIARVDRIKRAGGDPATVLDLAQHLIRPCVADFNRSLATGAVAEAGRIAAALADLIPGNPVLLNAAMSCATALSQPEEAARYARALLAVDPGHAGAQTAVAAADQASRSDAVQSLIRLRDLCDAAGEALCHPISEQKQSEVAAMLAQAAAIEIDAPAGSELEGWAIHYRLAARAMDLAAISAPSAEPLGDTPLRMIASGHVPLDWAALAHGLEQRGARAMFFVAADRRYVEMYARPYLKSLFRHCDVPFGVMVHVIGGADRLEEIASAVDVDDPRLTYTGDWFDAATVVTKCYDTPPKGQNPIPVAHYQSERFMRLGALLRNLGRPVFVSDIDLLLQRGVADLLDRASGVDVMLNENTNNTNAGSRLTANLLLANPSPAAHMFVAALSAYLDRALRGPAVSRWIDQFGLTIARQHLWRRAPSARIAYFDTESDVNNVMYRKFERNPFRFLSLYHGFDMSTLEAAA